MAEKRKPAELDMFLPKRRKAPEPPPNISLESLASAIGFLKKMNEHPDSILAALIETTACYAREIDMVEGLGELMQQRAEDEH